MAIDASRRTESETHKMPTEQGQSPETALRPPQRVGSCFCHGMAADPSAVSQVRRFTSTVLIEWRFGDEDVESAELIMSELATNAIRAAPRRPFGIRLSIRDGRPLLEV